MIPTSESITMDDSLSLADSLEWLHKHTNFPTFAEFRKNPEKYRANPDDIFESIQNINTYFKDRVYSVTYFWRGKYECKTLGKIYEIAKNEGCLANLEMEPLVEPMDGSTNGIDNRLKITVNVWPKDEFRRRGGIVAND